MAPSRPQACAVLPPHRGTRSPLPPQCPLPCHPLLDTLSRVSPAPVPWVLSARKERSTRCFSGTKSDYFLTEPTQGCSLGQVDGGQCWTCAGASSEGAALPGSRQVTVGWEVTGLSGSPCRASAAPWRLCAHTTRTPGSAALVHCARLVKPDGGPGLAARLHGGPLTQCSQCLTGRLVAALLHGDCLLTQALQGLRLRPGPAHGGASATLTEVTPSRVRTVHSPSSSSPSSKYNRNQTIAWGFWRSSKESGYEGLEGSGPATEDGRGSERPREWAGV